MHFHLHLHQLGQVIEKMTADVNEHFQRFKLLRKVESYPDFTLYLVEFRTPHPIYPLRALLKEYRSSIPEAHKEIGMLIDIAAQAPECLVVRYLHHIISKKKLYVFLEQCDGTLARAIGDRKQRQDKWTEGEVLHYMQGLLSTLRSLHVKRIAHRNINPATLLVQGSELKLAHFDDCKQVHVGTTLVAMTSIHGFETYLSPQLYQAYRGQLQGTTNTVTYQASYKDDIWAAGRVFYDMLTLRSQEDLMSMLEEGERGFTTCVERDLHAQGYSPRITTILLHMLTFDPKERPDAARLLEEVTRELMGEQCCHGDCGGYTSPWKPLLQVCEHSYCTSCITAQVHSAIQANDTLESLRCEECGPLVQRITELVPALQHQLDLLRLNQTLQCPNSGCTRKHATLQIASGVARNYQVICECGSKYCSSCHAAGAHGVFGLFARCPRLPF